MESKNRLQSFKELEYIRPDVEKVICEIEKAAAAITEAPDFAAFQEAFEAYHQVMETYNSAIQIADIRFTQDVRDPFYAQENDYLGDNMPRVEKACQQVNRAVMASPFREEIDQAYTPMLLKRLAFMAQGTGDQIMELLQEENHLCAQYNDIIGRSQIEFQGKMLTGPQLYPYKGSPDREVRKAAYRAEGEYYARFGDQLEALFEKLVQNRDAQAKALGFKNFSEVGRIRMNRMDYDLEDIAYYREQVKKYWVPAVNQIKKEQAERIGIQDFKGYDNLLYFADYNPVPRGTSEEMKQACNYMFHEMAPETGEFYDSLMARDMFDLDAREGKAPGGYCSKVDNLKTPFIFSNFNGTTMDVDVLIHESGHAMAAYEAYKNGIVPELQEPSSEACETHSTGMEMLTMPYHHLFFGEDTGRYDRFLMERTLTYLPGGVMGDAFQTEMYRHPEYTPEQRDQLWKDLTEEFTPHFSDFDDIPLYSDGRSWLLESLIFTAPFYQVDYGLARMVALQLLILAQTDPKAAWNKYLTFLTFGGTKTYRESVKAVGLEVPFEGETVKHVIEPVMEFMKTITV